MKSRNHKLRRKDAITAVASFLAVGIIFTPIFSVLHLTTADHRHRFNIATGLYEDIVTLGPKTAQEKVNHLPEPDERGAGGYSSFDGRIPRVSYVTCLISNMRMLRYIDCVIKVFSSPAAFQMLLSRGARNFLSRGAHLFLTAPKQSPPLSLNLDQI